MPLPNAPPLPPPPLPTSLHISCLCNSNTGTISPLSPTDLPLSSAFCLCPDCRRVSGQIAWTAATVPPTASISVTGPQTSYKTIANLIRYFCSTCGCHLWEVNTPSGIPGFCTGTVDVSGERVFEYRASGFAASTVDGGFSNWVPGVPAFVIDDCDGEVFEVGKQRMKMVEGREARRRTTPLREVEKLYAECHCGGVKFYITPPFASHSSFSPRSSASSSAPKSAVGIPYSNSLKPYYEHSAEEIANPNGEKWWERDHGTKYLAALCACRSCRLASGMDLQAWAFIPRDNIFWAGEDSVPAPALSTSDMEQQQQQQQQQPERDALPVDLQDRKLGTLQVYNSSPGVWRHFCRVCGATVFWRGKKRAEIIDVSVGLLRAEEGALARRWLEWNTERVSFREHASDSDLVQMVEGGMRRWGERVRQEEEEEADKEGEEREKKREEVILEKEARIDGVERAESGKRDAGADLADGVEGLKIQEG